MGITVALLSALFWGFTPIWTYICGGKPIQQLLGTTYGALIVGIALYLIKTPVISAAGFGWCFLAGAGWSLGQFTQYTALKRLSTSTTVPIVAGSQLIIVDLAGVLFFGSWSSIVAKIIGFIAILIVIIGVILSTQTGQSQEVPTHRKAATQDIVQVIVGTGIGYGACSILPKIPETSGWATFPPQSIGMIVSAVLFALCIKKYRNLKVFVGRRTIKNMLTGLNSGLGTFAYLGSIMMVGISTGFTLSQMNIVISSMAGLLFMHENKRGKALFDTIAGLILVLIGGVITGFIQ